MGQVWRAQHVAQEVPVALKVVTGRAATDPVFLQAFGDEVRAMARLDHPGIVAIFDHGELEPTAAAELGVPAGSPFLAMEYVAGRRVRPPSDWYQARALLVALLEALAHAHARGVIHRDIKPANILLPDIAGVPSYDRAKLTDFGIAHALDRVPTAPPMTTGTPAYMAPEQARCAWWEYGPWTDLYALGCFAWHLLTGERPFTGELSSILHKQISSELPTFLPRIEVPGNTAAWLARLLAKAPTQRFRACADARHALLSLDRPSVHPVRGYQVSTGASMPTLVALHEFDAPVMPDGPVPEPVDAMKATPCPLPQFWPLPSDHHRSPRLVGTGLGLYGMRPVPIVGRQAERGLLWATLVAVHEQGRAQLIALTGPAGTGKTRLAQWIGERAAQVGAGIALTAHHSAPDDPGNGLEAMAARYLGCTGLDEGQAAHRVRRWLISRGAAAPGEPEQLTQLVTGRINDRSERFAAVFQWLHRLTRERPVVLHIDDAQWGSEALSFARRLVLAGVDIPVMVVVTARSDALGERPTEAGLLQTLLESPSAQRLDVGPLPPRDHRALIAELLGLEDSLAAEVAHRTSGNPLFAVQLVGDWVHRGLLTASSRGFELAHQAAREVPDDIHALWSQRLASVVSHDGDLSALELYAVLGTDVHEHEWDEVCRRALGARPNQALQNALLREQLAMRSQRSWSFCHGMLRESLLRSARANDRLERWHSFAVETLRELYPADPPRDRIARHLVHAGRKTEAIQPLLVAMRSLAGHNAYHRGLELFALWSDVVEEVGADDKTLAAGWLECASAYHGLGRLDEAEVWCRRALAAAERGDATDTLCRASWALADIARRRGHIDEAWQGFTRARRLGVSQPILAAMCWRGLGRIARDRADTSTAHRFATKALKLSMQANDADGIAMSHTELAVVAQQEGNLTLAEEHYEQARIHHLLTRRHLGLVAVNNGLAELARRQGKLDAAYQSYLEVLEATERKGSSEVAVVRMNLALVANSRGQWNLAESHLQAARQVFNRQRRSYMVAAAHAVSLVTTANLRAWEAWDAHLQAAVEGLVRVGFADQDIAHSAEQAAETAALAGHLDRARRAYGLARAQWQTLGRDARVAQIEATLKGLT